MLTTTQMIIYILVTAAGVFATRVSAFLLFPSGRTTPKIIIFLGNALPCALMALLIVYCLKDISLIAHPHGLPELIALAVTALLHLWKKNTLLSISVGTVLYMILVQGVF